VEALQASPEKLILGCRDFTEEQVPQKSKTGNRITRNFCKYLCRIQVTDTQTGLRAISKKFMEKLMLVPGERFEFELNMLIEAGATVTCCNSKTKNIGRHTAACDILVSAIGKPKKINSAYFEKDSPCSLIIDVGINRDDNGKLCGDVDYDDIMSHHNDIYITPVPGSIGLTTRLQLMDNTIQAYLKSEEKFKIVLTN
jgi:hypothetical protein